MKDLHRLLEVPGTDPLEARLLRLARSEGPSHENRRRILAGLGMGVAAATVSQTGGAAQFSSSASSSAISSAAVKWGVASIVAVGVSVVAFMSLRAPAPRPLVTNSSVGILTASTAPVTPSLPPSIDTTELVPVTKVEDLPTLSADADAKAQSAPSLAEEVAAIKSAKAALAAGNAGQSLHELDAYRSRFPRGRLVQEASVVRIEALLKSGDSAAANAMADRFLAANADSPYAARVHTLIGR